MVYLSNTAFAESTEIQYGGSISYQSSTVGNFHVDGKRVFCMNHAKTLLSSGTQEETSLSTLLVQIIKTPRII